jgi:outer membrane biosynthesis protein TonB
MLDVHYFSSSAPEKLQIYADDPDYPEAARQKKMGAASFVILRYHGDKIDDAKILVSTNSPELDAELVKIVSDRLLFDMKADPQSQSVTRIFPVMFMPSFASSPKQLAAQRSQAQSAASSPAQSAPAP